jgi:hypothetical protein
MFHVPSLGVHAGGAGPSNQSAILGARIAPSIALALRVPQGLGRLSRLYASMLSRLYASMLSRLGRRARKTKRRTRAIRMLASLVQYLVQCSPVAGNARQSQAILVQHLGNTCQSQAAHAHARAHTHTHIHTHNIHVIYLQI